jgi:hypothetical protein
MKRIDKTVDEALITRIKALEDGVRELKVGNQFLEAEMFESTTASSYDLTGALAAAAATVVEAIVVVTATTADGVTPFLSSCAPEWWIPNMSTPFEYNYSTNYNIDRGIIPSPDGLSVRFWYNLNARTSVSASTFFFKYHVYSTAPVNVTVTRVL